jgi:hypothetical protein
VGRAQLLTPAVVTVSKSRWPVGPRGMIPERFIVGLDRERDVEFEFGGTSNLNSAGAILLGLGGKGLYKASPL